MTKSYFEIDTKKVIINNSWEKSIIAPKFTLRNFADELHYYLRIYIIKKKSIIEIAVYLFLNAVQRIFYTIGTNIMKIRHRLNSKCRL